MQDIEFGGCGNTPYFLNFFCMLTIMFTFNKHFKLSAIQTPNHIGFSSPEFISYSFSSISFGKFQGYLTHSCITMHDN